MARLNEPPVAPPSTATTGLAAAGAPIESVDALKRRFIRQNRELAKNNSNQSLKIRSLELEVSQLLADNLHLRAQVVEAQHSLQQARTKVSLGAVDKVRNALQAKIAELSGLVNGLDGLKENSAPVLVPGIKEKILSPSQRQYRERQPLAELMRDAQMPTIAEDKTYPRRTLDAEEIRAIRLSDHSSNGSPDLGPPPVARFDVEEAIKFSTEDTRSAQHPPRSTEENVFPESVAVNLETRRRRKDGSSRLEPRRSSILAQSPVKDRDDTASTMLRTGAKRKLADRELEKPIKPPSKEDFTFTRKSTAESARSESEVAPTKTEESKARRPVEHADVTTQSPPKPTRRVLGEKSANLSPRKVPAKSDKPAKDLLPKPTAKIPASKDRAPLRSRRTSTLSIPPLQNELAPSRVELQLPEPVIPDLPPTTPAGLDVFSPTPSFPSATVAAEKCDTPPPSELSTLSNTTDGGGLRPSRRARSAVNYAEPSLIAKMRRPDKQMVDALGGLQDARRVASASEKKAGTVIKTEPEDDDAWKSLPTAGGANQSGSPCAQKNGSDSATQRHEDGEIVDNAPVAMPSLGLVEPNRKRREASRSRFQSAPTTAYSAPASITKMMEEMDIYDFKDSSSPAADASTTSPDGGKTKHRRHSSVPKELGQGSVGTAAPAAELAGGRAAGRRRSMML